ncbi:MAG TPA: hypothetical protein VGL69_10170 [Solirubrobacteraceae bacterium]
MNRSSSDHAARAPRRAVLAAALAASAAAVPAVAQAKTAAATMRLQPNHLVVSTSQYEQADIQPGVTMLPPGCTVGASGCVTAQYDGAYPYVFNNDIVDASFGVTSPINLDQFSRSGKLVSSMQIPDSEMVTSFSSKSELSLNLSTSGKQISFMGYQAPDAALDVSNSNTPAVVDSTNPVPGSDYRVVGALHTGGKLSFTLTNAYSGNNGRAALVADSGAQKSSPLIYTAGNAGNGSNPQPEGVVVGAGAQIMNESSQPEADQTPGSPTPVGSFSVTQLNDPQDKIGKDDNFRGLAEYHNVLYFTKGSGSNGVNTVYFLDTTGDACPNGVGVPAASAPLPTSGLNFDPTTVASTGLPSNMCVLSGFPTTLAKTSAAAPFGMWFANPHTLYVADEGTGDNTYDASTNIYTTAASDTSAGLQKWVFDAASQTWQLAYTLQTGLNLGQPYTVAGYPVGDNSATSLPWAPANDGLRNITGRVNNGTATIYGVTSTVSGGGDEGADPNSLVAITDNIRATAAPAGEQFQTVVAPQYNQVVRGVTLTPGSSGLSQSSR